MSDLEKLQKLIKLTKEVRSLQTSYLKSKNNPVVNSTDLLNKSKKAEKELDEFIKELEKPADSQEALF